MQYCSATALAWAPGHCLSPRWQQRLTVWVSQQSGPSVLPPTRSSGLSGQPLNGLYKLGAFTPASLHPRPASALCHTRLLILCLREILSSLPSTFSQGILLLTI